MWILFDEIIEKHGWAPFQVVDAFRDGLLPYHIETGEPLPNKGGEAVKGFVLGQQYRLVLINWQMWAVDDYIIRALRDPVVVWRKADVDSYIRGQGQIPATIIPVSPGAKWHQVHFRLVNPTRIEITTPDEMKPFHPDDLKFTPKTLDLFERFASEDAEYIKEEKTDISRLRRLLRAVFPGVEGDPIPFEKLKGYKAAFHITEA
jgi:hypothetical protein